MTPVFPKEILPWHTAILGKTGKGKSTTARDLVEQVVPEGSRVCILDTVKSDWWGITSSADGKKPGLPFTILGGPHAHLPLSRNMGKAIAEVVASGALPLSIVDMADFGPGDPAHFFVDFAQALLKKMKGVLYLVIEEAHELAPKERAGFAKENMGVYWAKKLATAGRTRGLRMVVLTQRTQALHNAVLGSCETMVVHGMTAPADQDEVVKWLKANVKDKEIRRQVEESLSSLPTGTGWICSGEAKLFELKEFPRAKTYDNTATPEDDTELKEVKTATVNTEELRTILAGAVKEAEANDPTALKRRIAELERDIRHAKPAPAALAPVDTAPLERRAYEAGYNEGWGASQKAYVDGRDNFWTETQEKLQRALDVAVHGIQAAEGAVTYVRPPSNILLPPKQVSRLLADGIALQSAAHPKGNGKNKTPKDIRRSATETIEIDVALTPTQQKIVDALAELEVMGSRSPTRELLCFMAGYQHLNSKGFTNAIGALRTGGLIQGTTLTDAGRAAANPPTVPRTSEDLQNQLIAMLGGASAKILRSLIDVYPDGLSRATLLQAAGYEHQNSKAFANSIGRLRTLGFIDYPSQGFVVAQPVLFLQ